MRHLAIFLCLLVLAACGAAIAPNGGGEADASAETAADVAVADVADLVEGKTDAVAQEVVAQDADVFADADDALTDAIADAEILDDAGDDAVSDAVTPDADADAETDTAKVDVPLLPDVPVIVDVPALPDAILLDVPPDVPDVPLASDIADVPPVADVPDSVLPPDDVPAADAGPVDTGPADTGPADTGPADTGPVDTGPVDVGPDDTGAPDAGPTDTGPVDTGPADTGPVDTGTVDTGPVDTGPVDSGPVDTGPDVADVGTDAADSGATDDAGVDVDVLDTGPVCVPTANPTEICDGIDNNCNGLTDENACDDGNSCTTDTCTPTGCTFVAATGTCSDGNACTVADTCAAGVCVSGAVTVCAKAPQCNQAVCDTTTGLCNSVPVTGKVPCVDTNPCTTSEYCVSGVCTGLVVTNCNDNNPCTDDSCDSTGGCNHLYNAVACDDSNNCTFPDKCTNGGCVGGPPFSCDDSNVCTIDSCTVSGGCDHVAVTATTFCDADANACTVGDKCVSGVCTPGKLTVCSDGNPCTFDQCAKSTGECLYNTTWGTCDPSKSPAIACPIAGDTCVNKACFTPCDATHPCTNGGTCNGGLCTLVCDDGNLCTTNDQCNAMALCAGVTNTCDDGLVCTIDACDKATGKCSNVNQPGAACDDGNACTAGDACNTYAVCVSGTGNGCDDANPCTTDACVSKACTHTAMTGACDDGTVCTTGETCATGSCVPPNVQPVSTLAGGATAGSKDGKGTAAQFSGPRGLVLDSAGVLWVADTGNSALRKVAADGTVTTVTSTFADTPSAFSAPQSLAIAADGTVWIADTGNHRIRKRTASGTVTTFAGSGTAGFVDGKGSAAQFSSPYGVIIGPGGWLFVADRGNNRIRRISPDGNVTTLAGTGGTGSTNGAGTSATFNAPSAIAWGPGGNFYVADAGSGLIRVVTPAGVVSIGAGSTVGFLDGALTTAKFSNPTAIVASGQGLAVADTGNNRIRLIGSSVATALGSTSGFLDGGSDVAKFAAMQGLAIGPNGTVYIADTGNNRIRQVVMTTTTCDDSNACTVDTCDPVKGCTFTASAAGTACSDGDACTTGDACTAGSCKGTAKNCDDGNACTDDVCDPNSAVCGHNSTGLACNDGNACTLGETCVAATCTAEPGSVSTLAGQQLVGSVDGLGSAASFSGPRQLWSDGSGGIYVADTGNNKIRDVAADGTASTIAGSGTSGSSDGAALTATFKGPQGVTVVGSTIWIADTGNNKLRTVSGGIVASPVGTGTAGFKDGAGVSALFNGPQAIAADTNGTLFVADTLNHRIRKVKQDGTVSTLAGTGVAGFKDGANTIAQFSSPSGVAVDAFHNVWVADMNNYRIRKVTPDGTVSTFAGSGTIGQGDGTGTAATFYLPGQLAFDSAGNLWTVDHGYHRVRKITPAGVVTTPMSAVNGGFKDGIATAALFSSPWGIWAQSDGTILIGDTSNNRIRKHAPTAVVCGDGNDCTADTCDPTTGTCSSANVANGTACQAGDACSTSKTCSSGACTGGTVKTCSDANVCTVDACDGTSGACTWTWSTSCQPVRRVFVSSATFTGALAGVGGADTQCQNAATAKTLGGSWKAWLSDATGNPASRFDQAASPYVLLDRTPIANNWADLTDGTLAAPINLDETGKTPAVAPNTTNCFTTPIRVFTNTNKDGTAFSTLAADTCNGWTSSTSNTVAYHQMDGYGDASNNQWSEGCANDYCDRVSHLYCFEQADTYVLNTTGFHTNGKYFVSNATYAGDFNAAGGFCTALLGQTAYIASTSAFLPDTEPYTVWDGNSSASSTTLNCSAFTSALAAQSGVGVQGGSTACNVKRAVVCSTDPNDCSGGSANCALWD